MYLYSTLINHNTSNPEAAFDVIRVHIDEAVDQHQQLIVAGKSTRLTEDEEVKQNVTTWCQKRLMGMDNGFALKTTFNCKQH